MLQRRRTGSRARPTRPLTVDQSTATLLGPAAAHPTSDPTTRRFVVQPRRWVIEPTFGWLMQHHCLVRDYQALPARSEAMIHLAAIDLMSRRLTGQSTPTWRGT
ncbi:transposase [Actinomadura fulvescens]|uniref:Transposase DDE domain-containing protein n=1 Tax=Actinomadura fulvescens TaxID=46160 RepID=A0ABN3QUR3_9ACTN